jgi:cell wall surface anchor family protein
MKRILLFLSMLLLVGGTTMAFANGANGSDLTRVSNNENGASTNAVVQPQNNNSGVKPLETTNNKYVITFTTSKEIGESIKLTDMLGRSLGYMEIEGALRDGYSDSYFLTAQTVKIIDYCSDLNCSKNGITSIDCSNSSLERLDCSSNQLTSLILPNKPKLKELNCSSNQLTSLDLSKNSALERLDCSSNQLTSLNLSNNRVLKGLDCSSNQLTSLDLSKKGELERLDCSKNGITSLDLSKNSRLKRLDCSSNQLTSLNLSNNPILEHLFCSLNQLTLLDLTHCRIIDLLDCQRNKITQIKLPYNPQYLSSIDCASNNIDVKHMEQLINSLPERSIYRYGRNKGQLYVQSSSTDGNQITQEQEKEARNKRWNVLGVYKYTTTTGIATIDNADASPRKVFDLNGCEVNENQAKGVVIVKQGNKTYKKVVK